MASELNVGGLVTTGDVLVGKTTASSSVHGGEIRATGQVVAAVDGSWTGLFNRETDDGEIIRFKKDDAAIGSIGTANGDSIIIGNSTGNLILYAATVAPSSNNAGGASNGVVSLGTDSRRFKDLYLSGGVVFGPTAGVVTSKSLDDYEEGTWTPVIGGGSCTNLVGKYTKVGNKVTVTVSVLSGALTSATTNQITNLPFTCGSTRSATSAVAFYNCMGNASPVGLVIEGATRIDFVYNVASGAWATANFVNSTGNALHFSATYFV